LRNGLDRPSWSRPVGQINSHDGEASGAGHGDSGGPVFTCRGLPALVGIIAAMDSDRTMAVPIAPNYNWIMETMDRLGAR